MALVVRLLITAQVVDLVLVWMLAIEELGNLIDRVSEPSLNAFRRVAHGYDILGDVGQIQIVAILNIAVLLLGDHTPNEVPAALACLDLGRLVHLFDLLRDELLLDLLLLLLVVIIRLVIIIRHVQLLILTLVERILVDLIHHYRVHLPVSLFGLLLSPLLQDFVESLASTPLVQLVESHLLLVVYVAEGRVHV